MEDSEQICPNCKRGVTKKNFGLHTAFCERNIKLCESCEEPVKINELEKHLNEEHAMVACKQCDEPLEKWMLTKHKELCFRRLIECKFCEAEFPFDEYGEHERACGARTEKCTYCRKFIMIKDLERHNQMHIAPMEKIKPESDCETVQNKVNEHISNSYVSVPRKFNKDEKKIEATTSEIENFYPERRPLRERTSKSIDHGNDIHSDSFFGATACVRDLPDKSEAFRKRYAVCPICKKDIPWLDFNLHMPTCATDAGKCSVCHENVPPDQIKDHIMKYCGKRHRRGQGDYERNPRRGDDAEVNPTNAAGFELEEIEPRNCPFCNQLCSENHILDHIRDCDKNLYECPLCEESLPEKYKEKHETYYCRVINEVQENNTSAYPSSYADSVKRSSPDWQSVPQHNTVNCGKCKNSFSKHKISAHRQQCQGEMKRCRFCNKDIPAKQETNHLKQCPVVLADQTNPRHSSQYRGAQTRSGAIPKNSQRKGVMTRCCYCDNPYNADLLPFHERECVKQSLLCEVCHVLVPLTELELHAQEFHYGKGKKGSKPREKHDNTDGIFGKIYSFFGKKVYVQDPLPPENYRYPDYVPRADSQIYSSIDPNAFTGGFDFSGANSRPSNIQTHPKPETAQLILPCEFCDQVLFDEVDYIAHMSLDHADEVCVKKDTLPTQDVKYPDSSKRENRRYVETATSKPGEFLEYSRKADENEQFDASEHMTGFQSCWNFESVSPQNSRKFQPDEENVFPINSEDALKSQIVESQVLISRKQSSAHPKYSENEHKISSYQSEMNKNTEFNRNEFFNTNPKKIDKVSLSSDMEISPTPSEEEKNPYETSKILKNVNNKHLKSAYETTYKANQYDKVLKKQLLSSGEKQFNVEEKMDHDGSTESSSTEDLHAFHKSPLNMDLKKDKSKDMKKNAVSSDSSSDEDIDLPQKTHSGFKISPNNDKAGKKTDFDRSSTEESHESDLDTQILKQKNQHYKQCMEKEKIYSASHKSSSLDYEKNKLKFDANKKVLFNKSKNPDSNVSSQSYNRHTSEVQSDSYVPEVAAKSFKFRTHDNNKYLEEQPSVKLSDDESCSSEDSRKAEIKHNAAKQQFNEQNKIAGMHSSTERHKINSKYASKQHTDSYVSEVAAQSSKFRTHHSKKYLEEQPSVKLSDDESCSSEDSRKAEIKHDVAKQQFNEQNKIAGMHSSTEMHKIDSKYASKQHTGSFISEVTVKSSKSRNHHSNKLREDKNPVKLSDNDSSSDEDFENVKLKLDVAKHQQNKIARMHSSTERDNVISKHASKQHTDMYASDVAAQSSKSRNPDNDKYKEKQSSLKLSGDESSSNEAFENDKLKYDFAKKELQLQNKIAGMHSSIKKDNINSKHEFREHTDLHESKLAIQSSKSKKHHGKEYEKESVGQMSTDTKSLSEKKSKPVCDAYRMQILQHNKIDDLHATELNENVLNICTSGQQKESFESHAVAEDKKSEKNSKYTQQSKFSMKVPYTHNEKSSAKESHIGQTSSLEEIEYEKDTRGLNITKDAATEEVLYKLAYKTAVTSENSKNLYEENFRRDLYFCDGNTKNIQIEETYQNSNENDSNSFEIIEMVESEKDQYKIDFGLTGFQKIMQNIKSGAVQLGTGNSLVKSRTSSDPSENAPTYKYNERKNSLEADNKVSGKKAFDFDALIAKQQDAEKHIKKLLAETKSLLNEPVNNNPIQNDAISGSSTYDDKNNCASSVKYQLEISEENAFKIEPAQMGSCLTSRNLNFQKSPQENVIRHASKENNNSFSTEEFSEQQISNLVAGNNYITEQQSEDHSCQNKSTKDVFELLKDMEKSLYCAKLALGQDPSEPRKEEEN